MFNVPNFCGKSKLRLVAFCLVNCFFFAIAARLTNWYDGEVAFKSGLYDGLFANPMLSMSIIYCILVCFGTLSASAWMVGITRSYTNVAAISLAAIVCGATIYTASLTIGPRKAERFVAGFAERLKSAGIPGAARAWGLGIFEREPKGARSDDVRFLKSADIPSAFSSAIGFVEDAPILAELDRSDEDGAWDELSVYRSAGFDWGFIVTKQTNAQPSVYAPATRYIDCGEGVYAYIYFYK